MSQRSVLWAATATVMVVVTLTACRSSNPSASSSTSSNSMTAGQVLVVASTDVWGAVVKHVAGDLAVGTVHVTSLIRGPNVDPHTYEADAQARLALSKANVVVKNGGGYDDFVDTMLAVTDDHSATVLDAVDISGRTAPEGGEFNEHVWYDYPTVQKVAAQIEATLAEADPKNASTYAANLKAFNVDLAKMMQVESDLKSAHAGEGVAVTEPVPLYLLQACGLVNKTPEEFSEAVEQDTDVSPRSLNNTIELFHDHDVVLLAYNEQTSSSQSLAVKKAATDNDIPVVEVTETLPAGDDYLSWMWSNLTAVQSALR